MKEQNTVRVRFAPAPTGMMHLGNIRTALMNYLMAQQKQGVFVIRIEDTDADRNYDPQADNILQDLAWLSLEYTEGPVKGGPHVPYFQSQRNDLYQQKLQELIALKKVYRCFCSTEELEKKRDRQIALKQPPRYDRTCAQISDADSLEKAKTHPFIWRFFIDHSLTLQVTDLAHGIINFEAKNFSDFPLTRQDGSVTFIFANFVDDVMMQMTCVIRGEDHLSNTANQVALYKACNAPIPTFWHLPILCNKEGKKLSKRDFGFSLRDLKNAGYLPEAIVNYLAIIGASFKEEIMSLQELVSTLDFSHIATTGQIKYDVEKLNWVNHKWIQKLPLSELINRSLPFIEATYPEFKKCTKEKQIELFTCIRSSMTTLEDAKKALDFYFKKPEYTLQTVHEIIPLEWTTELKKKFFVQLLLGQLPVTDTDLFLAHTKEWAQVHKQPMKILFTTLRYALMGNTQGPSIKELIIALGTQESTERIITFVEFAVNEVYPDCRDSLAKMSKKTSSL